jgi:hypothetical protein
MSESMTLAGTQRLSTFVANRISRRSFIGRVSGVAAAAAAGAAAFPDPAAALTCDCPGGGCNTGCNDRSKSCGVNGHSVTCGGLTGNGGQCPYYTVACGSWGCTCSSQCPGSQVRIWTDCCAIADQCSDPSSCRCVRDTDGVTRPTCCYGHCYQGGGTNCHHIVCRYQKCA